MPRKKNFLDKIPPLHSIIHVVRGERVILDADLAKIYGTTTKRLLEQFKRNRSKFPSDFAYLLKKQELTILRSQIATSSWGGRRNAPIAFTEHGAIMAATILNSEEAVAMSIFVVRAFVRMRQVMTETKDLTRRLDELEDRITERLDGHEETIDKIFQDLRTLLAPKTSTRRIGFVIKTEEGG